MLKVEFVAHMNFSVVGILGAQFALCATNTSLYDTLDFAVHCLTDTVANNESVI